MNNGRIINNHRFDLAAFTASAITCLGFLLLVSGCSEVIEWDVENSRPQLVVEGVVTSENKKHHVFLSSTQEVYGGKGIAGVSNATVTITEGTSVYALEESSEKKGFYETTESFAGEPGKTYRLDVQLETAIGGIQNLQATAVMPHLLTMDSIKIESETIFGTETYSVKLFGKDPKDTENYYLMYVYKNDTLLSDDLSKIVIFDNEDIEGLDFDDFTIYTDDNIRAGDSIEVEVLSVTEDYYEYMLDLIELADGGDPLGFSGPPANVYGNVGKNVFGYFYATPVSRLENVAEE